MILFAKFKNYKYDYIFLAKHNSKQESMKNKLRNMFVWHKDQINIKWFNYSFGSFKYSNQ